MNNSTENRFDFADMLDHLDDTNHVPPSDDTTTAELMGEGT